MAKPQGNHVLRYPTILNVPISKEEMGIITATGLIKEIDDNGFVIFDNDHLSGSHVYWSNLKEIRQMGDQAGILLIYKNLADEIFPNTYANWNALMDGIPEDFGDFSNMKIEDTKDSETTEDFSELTGIDYDEAKELVSEINQMRAKFMGNSSAEDSEEISELEEVEADSLEPKTTAVEEMKNTPSVEAKTRYEVESYESSPQLSDQALLQKILAEASGSQYTSENLRYQRDEEALTANVTFKANARIEQMSSLGFEVHVGGKIHKIDFGKFSDAYFSDRDDALIFEHRNGKTVTFPRSVQNWMTMIQKMPFRFRSFDRKKMLSLACEK
ncbi:MAG: hypothetical protein ACPGJS_05655 [Flammeovirgaceae bacterium]